jgi:hypothetical protein
MRNQRAAAPPGVAPDDAQQHRRYRMKRRPTSNSRKRQIVLTARFNEDEARAIRTIAEQTGLSLGALLRHALLEVPPPHARHRPSVDHEAVARLLGELGKIGSNVNQLAYYAHLGRFQSNSIDVALRDLMELRLACLQALGREPLQEASPPS